MTITATRELPVRNPRTGQVDFRISAPGAPELAALAARLRAAQPAWAAAGPARRSAILKAWSEYLLAASGALREALAIDTGRHLLAGNDLGRMKHAPYWSI